MTGRPMAVTLALGFAAAAALSCRADDPGPAQLDTAVDTCRSCRMPVSDRRLAAQLAAPGEEPAFFDDIGCLRDFLRQNPPDAGAVAFVADHRDGYWLLAARAVYDRCPSIETPMGSHLIARAERSELAGCEPLSAETVFGVVPPNGKGAP